jgi:hypothetical protein
MANSKINQYSSLLPKMMIFSFILGLSYSCDFWVKKKNYGIVIVNNSNKPIYYLRDTISIEINPFAYSMSKSEDVNGKTTNITYNSNEILPKDSLGISNYFERPASIVVYIFDDSLKKKKWTDVVKEQKFTKKYFLSSLRIDKDEIITYP